MTGEFLVAACGVMLAIALAIAAFTDLRWRIIPDRLNIAIALAAPLAWWAQGLAFWPDMAVQAAVGACFFAFFLLQFHFNVMGGGDVKLGGALALWVAPTQIVPFLTVTVLAGAAISVVMMLALLVRGQPLFAGGASLRLPDDEDAEAAPVEMARVAPYGLAIAAGGWWVIYQQYFNHFAAQAAV